MKLGIVRLAERALKLKQLKQRTVRLAERAFNCRIYTKMPHGIEVFSDRHQRLPSYRIRTIFDVGAHVGESVREFVRAHPEARVYCFEPFLSTFERLRDETAGNPYVRCFPLALGAKKESIRIYAKPLSSNNSLWDWGTASADTDSILESVEVDTLDSVTAVHEVEHIDFLKIDTEGYDLEVLRGAENLLRTKRITFVQVEASMNRLNTKHVDFGAFMAYLEERGYLLFGLYDQTPEWSGEPRLRYCNPVFVLEEPLSP